MKIFILSILCCFFSFASFAQTTPQTVTVKGIVIDSAINKPLGYVTIALQDAATNLPVKSNLTKDDGTFELKAPAGKLYKLVLAFVGYNSKILTLKSSGNVFDFGKIMMETATNQLKDVVITAVKPLMTQEVDRISYNVAADPESKSVTALDMMRKVPLLTLDANDNIQLKGSGNYKILINGKESALLAKNPSDVLRSMPGTNIVKIEVITTPPAKYDAEGLAGIINIITTKSIDEGYNIGVNSRYNTAWGPGVNLNVTVKQGKFGFSGYAGFGSRNKTITPYNSTEDFFSNQSVLSQSGLNSWNGNYKYANGDFSYEIDTLNLLTASVDYEIDNNGQTTNGLTKTMIGDSTSQQYFENNQSNSRYQAFDASINYQLGFKRSKDQLLTLSYKYSYSPNSQATNNDFSEQLNYPQANYYQNNNAGTREHTIQLDYAQPFNKQLSMETGAKAILRNDFSDFQSDTLNNISNQFTLDPTQTNDFTYHQNIYSLYNSYQLKLAKWTAKAGLRLEETTIGAEFSSVDTSLKTNYTNLIPSVSIQRSLTSTSSVNFGFTERIQRPDIYELNPFINRSNPQFITYGNPDLKPELNHVFELNYSRFSKGSINVGLSYSFSNNSIQNISNLEAGNVTYSTYQNLGSNQSLGLNVNTNYPITTKLSLNINGLLNHVWLKGTYDGSQDKNSGYVGNMFTSISYKFDNGYRIGTNTGYFSGNVNLQGTSSYFIFNSYVFSKDLFKKNANISFVANNPWSKFWNGSSYTRTPDFYQVSTNENTYRNFAIRISYKFGKLNSDIKKNEHGINNDDTKGKSAGGQ
jgi:outer membrane receptor protein involved in Fe transport